MIIQLKVKTEHKNEMVDLTSNLKEIVKDIKEGILTLYTQHSTTAIIINENSDPNVPKDIFNSMEKIIPESDYLHNLIHDNATAHIKSSIMGASKSIPIENGKLLLGIWQSPMLVEFDGPKERTVIVHIQ